MWNERIDTSDYSLLMNKFTCKKFNAGKWVDIAKQAGCKYMVKISKQYDGFCLFETHFRDFDAVNSAAKRDLIAEYIQAAQQADMRTGIYYSPRINLFGCDLDF
jgi:alpha-L-fucosidase